MHTRMRVKRILSRFTIAIFTLTDSGRYQLFEPLADTRIRLLTAGQKWRLERKPCSGDQLWRLQKSQNAICTVPRICVAFCISLFISFEYPFFFYMYIKRFLIRFNLWKKLLNLFSFFLNCTYLEKMSKQICARVFRQNVFLVFTQDKTKS